MQEATEQISARLNASNRFSTPCLQPVTYLGYDLGCLEPLFDLIPSS